MKKLLLIFVLCFNFFLNINNVHSNTGDIILPEEINWTERYILTEIKELRIDHETLKREMITEVQNRELEAVDKALSYSANTVNFFFVFLTIVMMGFGIVGWRTVGDIKKATKENMDKETSKIIKNFQEKIEELEKEQKINILWRQFNLSESDSDKMTLLDRINYLKPESQYVTIERSNVYLSMGIYDKVIELSDEIIGSDRTKHQSQAYFNKACANAMLLNTEQAIDNISHLLNMSPDYKDTILESTYLVDILKEEELEELLA